MSPNIRVASQSDISRIIPLWNEFMDSHVDTVPSLRIDKDRELSAKENIGWRLEQPNYRFFLAETKGGVAGFLSCHIMAPSHLIQSIGGYITETVVKDSFQRNGIGTQLFETACKWMFENGATSIWLKTTMTNEAVHTFCQKAGFKPVFQHLVYHPG